MSVYMVMEAKVKDEKKYGQYLTALSDILPKYGGRYLVRGGRVTPLFRGLRLERRQSERMILVEFPSEVQVRRCFASPECQAIVPLAKEGAETWAALMEGYVPEEA